jgi:hypothetical protein
MDSTSWEQIKSRYKLGQFVIKIPDFLDEGEMSEEMYPEIGTTIGAVVVGYNESNCREIYLNAKPSVLHKALVPLKIPALAG